MDKAPPELIIIAVLTEAQRAGVRSLKRTVLHKLVYLVDVYAAGCRQGETCSDADWRFMHFGPFATTVASSLEALVGRGDVFAASGVTGNDVEFTDYSIRRGLSLGIKDLNLGDWVNQRVASDIKRYANDLSALLDYVYFRTAPMATAKPGDALDFSGCEWSDVRDFKPVAMKKVSKGKLEHARSQLRAIAAKANVGVSRYPVGPYDEAYFAGIASFESEPLPIDVPLKARIVD